MNAKWLTANSKKCPKCKAWIQKTHGCNWMECASCKHGFCWLCMGDAAAHPGMSGPHPAQCNNVGDVMRKGRGEFMKEENFDPAEFDNLNHVIKKFESTTKRLDSLKEKRTTTIAKIDEFIQMNPELKLVKADFESLIYCFNLMIAAAGAINNTCAVQYYLKEIDKEIIVLPEEISDIQLNLEMNIDELEHLTNNWQSDAFDKVNGSWTKGGKFVPWKVRVKREKNEFKQLLNSKMKWIRTRLTPESEESKANFNDMVKALSMAVPQ